MGNTVYISGQVGLDRDGKLVGKDDPIAQARQAVENIKAILNEIGAGAQNIVKMKTYYISHRSHQQQHGKSCAIINVRSILNLNY
ncbi:hypothetical protein JCM17380_03820 [Desulfosporosinus burensis]